MFLSEAELRPCPERAIAVLLVIGEWSPAVLPELYLASHADMFGETALTPDPFQSAAASVSARTAGRSRVVVIALGCPVAAVSRMRCMISNTCRPRRPLVRWGAPVRTALASSARPRAR